MSNPAWLDTGDNAWQLTAGTLVALQSVPGLVVLYAGIVKSKWAINSAFMAFYAFACVLICWVIWGYKVAFGDEMMPFAGYPQTVMSSGDELGQSCLPAIGADLGAPYCQNFPQATMVYFQFVFAAITVVLIAGALLGRMNFLAWMIFVPFWLSFSYCVGAFSIWGGGFLYRLGVIDYSGGYVIHVSSGTAGYVAAAWVGPRLAADRADNRPNNVLCVLIGAGILWVGWNGFNGGDPYAASADAGVAVLNTNVCTAMSLLTWTMMDIIFHGKPSIIGAVNGMITGLVGITPAAGVVATWGAIVIGFLEGTIPWMTMNWMAKKFKLFHKVDDTLGIFHTHAIGGVLGGFCTGLFATVEGCAAFGISNPGGAIAGNGIQIAYQLAGAGFIIGWNIVWTSLILLAIKYILRIPLRMSEEQLRVGDDAIHGESAYVYDFDVEGRGPGDSRYTSGQQTVEGISPNRDGVFVDDPIMGKNGNTMPGQEPIKAD